MEIEQTNRRVRTHDRPGRRSALSHKFDHRMRRGATTHVGYAVFRFVFLLAAVLLLGASALSASQARVAAFGLAVSGRSFDLLGWGGGALSRKAEAAWQRPSSGVTDNEGAVLVRAFLARAARVAAIERELTWRMSQAEVEGTGNGRAGSALGGMSTALLQGELEVLRARQDLFRPAVEQILERHVSEALVDAGFGMAGFLWPPVQFTFTEPPKKLIVSGRDQISTVYSRMLVAGMALHDIEQAEEAIARQHNAVGYVTDIGGLGTYPSMVVDRAGLRWVLSTVAHEWVHNYLAFFPLGLNYFASQEMTTLNESVAEIVGNEIGDLVYTGLYGGEILPSPPPVTSDNAEPDVFDFRTEMRATRLEVDRLLEAGRVAEAEAYMDTRRLEFVENGYPLRVLNQAYFAFHGSYGTSPASTSPIGPDAEKLRELSPDLATFLQTVRWFTSVEDLDRVLVELER